MTAVWKQTDNRVEGTSSIYLFESFVCSKLIIYNTKIIYRKYLNASLKEFLKNINHEFAIDIERQEKN